MSTLAVLAHYDPRGKIAQHVQYQIDQIRPVADRLVFVSTSAQEEPTGVDEFIVRENIGHDFYSYRTGLLANDFQRYDRVILSNDSYVGPLVPIDRFLQTGVFGITTSDQIVPHVQSYFLSFDRATVADPAFAEFWEQAVPLDNRQAVIDNYELGLARFTPIGSYFRVTAHEKRLMAARIAAHHRGPLAGALAGAAAYALQPVRRVEESPVLGLWDRVFDDARLPAVKVSLFTQNPYRIDRNAALTKLERQFPAAFAGFRSYLQDLGIDL